MNKCLMEYRTTIYSDFYKRCAFPEGTSLADMLMKFDPPKEFRTHGVILLHDPEKHGYDEMGLPKGDAFYPHTWHLVRPKGNVIAFASIMPKGGMSQGSGGGEKNVWQTVGMVAIAAATIWLTAGGGIGLIAGFTGLSVGAVSIGVAAISTAATIGLAYLTRPSVGTPSSGASAKFQPLGSSGISGNTLGAYQQVPAVLGSMRMSPPLLTRPYTRTIDGDEWVYACVGACGRLAINDIKVNETDIEDSPSTIEYETREGQDNDLPLSIITQSWFQENINTQMSVHRLDEDEETLMAPYLQSYPKPHIFRSARNIDRFRVSLTFPAGFIQQNGDGTTGTILVAFRPRMRRVGSSTWINLPELHLQTKIRRELRQEIWFVFGDQTDKDEIIAEVSRQKTRWSRQYAKNSEWTAHEYFGTNTGSLNPSCENVFSGSDAIYIFLDKEVFEQGQYDFELTRSAAAPTSNFTTSQYEGGLFTYRTQGSYNTDTSEYDYRIYDQSNRISTCIIRHYTSIRKEYPIVARNLALICLRAKNTEINSISAVFSSYVDGVGESANPADLFKMVLTDRKKNKGKLIELSRIDDLSAWHSHNVSKNLECNAIVNEGSLEKALALVSACGDAIPRRSDSFGVVIDKDRSAEPIAAMFHQGNMTSPLVRRKTFINGARAIVPNFVDSTQDYRRIERLEPVYDDTYGSGDVSDKIDAVPYEGYVTDSAVVRRVTMDLRRRRLRSVKYTWGASLRVMNLRKGEVIGIGHDTLSRVYGAGRVRSFATVFAGSPSVQYLTEITMNTAPLDLPPATFDNVFEITPNIFDMQNMWFPSPDVILGASIGAQIELTDGSVINVPIASVDGKTLYVEGDYVYPSGLAATCMITVGLRDYETRRLILTNIQPRNNLEAILEGVDEANEVHEGL